MFGVKAIIDSEFWRVKAAVDKASFRNMSHAAASIRKVAIASIETDSEPSKPGSPPHSRRGLLRRAIWFGQEPGNVVIGPAASIAGQAGQPHEFGGDYKGETYPARPFMGPALESQRERFPSAWADSL